MKFKYFFAFALLALVLTGCTEHKIITYSYVTTDSVPQPAIDKNSQAELANAAVSVDHSLQNMSAIAVATHPGAKVYPPVNPASIGMAEEVSLDWTGPVEPLLVRLAKASHYRLRVLGNKPAIPVIVIVHEKNQPLAYILRNVRYQINKKADIRVFPQSRIIELRYYLI